MLTLLVAIVAVVCLPSVQGDWWTEKSWLTYNDNPGNLEPEGIGYVEGTGFIVSSFTKFGLHQIADDGFVTRFAAGFQGLPTVGFEVGTEYIAVATTEDPPSITSRCGVAFYQLDGTFSSYKNLCETLAGPNEVRFLNDVAFDVSGNGYVYATLSYPGAIYMLHPDSDTPSVLASDPVFEAADDGYGLNGIVSLNIPELGNVLLATYSGTVADGSKLFLVTIDGGNIRELRIVGPNAEYFTDSDGLVYDAYTETLYTSGGNYAIALKSEDGFRLSAYVYYVSFLGDGCGASTCTLVDGDLYVSCWHDRGVGPYTIPRVAMPRQCAAAADDDESGFESGFSFDFDSDDDAAGTLTASLSLFLGLCVFKFIL